jgi:hypothetical protein
MNAKLSTKMPTSYDSRASESGTSASRRPIGSASARKTFRLVTAAKTVSIPQAVCAISEEILSIAE